MSPVTLNSIVICVLISLGKVSGDNADKNNPNDHHGRHPAKEPFPRSDNGTAGLHKTTIRATHTKTTKIRQPPTLSPKSISTPVTRGRPETPKNSSTPSGNYTDWDKIDWDNPEDALGSDPVLPSHHKTVDVNTKTTTVQKAEQHVTSPKKLITTHLPSGKPEFPRNSTPPYPSGNDTDWDRIDWDDPDDALGSDLVLASHNGTVNVGKHTAVINTKITTVKKARKLVTPSSKPVTPPLTSGKPEFPGNSTHPSPPGNDTDWDNIDWDNPDDVLGPDDFPPHHETIHVGSHTAVINTKITTVKKAGQHVTSSSKPITPPVPSGKPGFPGNSMPPYPQENDTDWDNIDWNNPDDELGPDPDPSLVLRADNGKIGASKNSTTKTTESTVTRAGQHVTSIKSITTPGPHKTSTKPSKSTTSTPAKKVTTASPTIPTNKTSKSPKDTTRPPHVMTTPINVTTPSKHVSVTTQPGKVTTAHGKRTSTTTKTSSTTVSPKVTTSAKPSTATSTATTKPTHVTTSESPTKEPPTSVQPFPGPSTSEPFPGPSTSEPPVPNPPTVDPPAAAKDSFNVGMFLIGLAVGVLVMLLVGVVIRCSLFYRKRRGYESV